MSALGQDTTQVLQYLLPGFLAAWIFYGLTPHTKPQEFERVIQALIFTLIVQTIVFLERLSTVDMWRLWTQTAWNATAQYAAPAITAVIVGLAFAGCANNDLSTFRQAHAAHERDVLSVAVVQRPDEKYHLCRLAIDR